MNPEEMSTDELMAKLIADGKITGNEKWITFLKSGNRFPRISEDMLKSIFKQ